MTLMTRSNPESVQRCVGVSWPLSVSISYERELVTPAHPAHLLALAPVLRTGSLALRSSLRFATRFAPQLAPTLLRCAPQGAHYWETTIFTKNQISAPAPKGLGSRGARGGAQRRPAAERL